jgi:HK97 family phage portal protein
LLYYKRLANNNKERAKDDYLYFLLNFKPNSYQTRFEFIELLVNHVIFRGNFYALKRFTHNGELSGLIPLNPDMVTPEASSTSGEVVISYKVTNTAGAAVFNSSQILHVRNHSDDGIVGKSTIEQARDVIEVSLSLDKQSSSSFKNAARLSGILEHPQILSEEGAQRIAKSWRETYAGTGNAGSVAILEEGMTFKPVSMTNTDAQFIESREFQLTEIARIFRMPPHMIQDLSRATYSNIEAQGINFVTHTIRPMAVRIETALCRDLVAEEKQKEYYIEFLLDALMRGDAQSRGDFYSKMFNVGAYSVNNILAKENENGIGPEGDKHFVPVNMVPIEKAGNNIVLANPKENPKEKDEPKEKEKPKEGKSARFAQVFDCWLHSSRKLLAFPLERIITKETKAVERATGKVKDMNDWASEFYAEHKTYMRTHLEPVISICHAQLGLLYQTCERAELIGSVEKILDTYIGDHLTERYRSIADNSVIINMEPFAEAEKLLGIISNGT